MLLLEEQSNSRGSTTRKPFHAAAGRRANEERERPRRGQVRRREERHISECRRPAARQMRSDSYALRFETLSGLWLSAPSFHLGRSDTSDAHGYCFASVVRELRREWIFVCAATWILRVDRKMDFLRTSWFCRHEGESKKTITFLSLPRTGLQYFIAGSLFPRKTNFKIFESRFFISFWTVKLGISRANWPLRVGSRFQFEAATPASRANLKHMAEISSWTPALESARGRVEILRLMWHLQSLRWKPGVRTFSRLVAPIHTLWTRITCCSAIPNNNLNAKGNAQNKQLSHALKSVAKNWKNHPHVCWIKSILLFYLQEREIFVFKKERQQIFVNLVHSNF